MSDLSTWAWSVLGRAPLGHRARTTRAVAMLAQMATSPAGTVPAVFREVAACKAAYRLLESPAVPAAALARGAHEATARACAAHALVVVPVDGSSLAHTDRRAAHGVGSIGARDVGARGLKTMVLLPLTYDGVPLGVGAHALWARDARPAEAPHTRRALAHKESRWWTALQDQFEAGLHAQGAATVPWYQIDREGDASHVLLRGARPGVHLTVRAYQDRLLTARRARGAHLKLHAAVATAPVAGVMYLAVPRGRGRVERVARLEVGVVGVGLKLRDIWTRSAVGDVAVTAVRVREVGTAPPGVEPLEWLLLTTFPVHSFDDAVRVVRAYGLRWVVERVHFTWKSGACRVEDSQLESFEALCKWATLHLCVAVHHQQLLHLSRTEPERPADVAFTREEIDAALTLYTAHRADGPRPGETPTLGALVQIVARLGGYQGKSSGGPPGLVVFRRGMEHVQVAALAFKLQRQLARSRGDDDDFG